MMNCMNFRIENNRIPAHFCLASMENKFNAKIIYSYRKSIITLQVFVRKQDGEVGLYRMTPLESTTRKNIEQYNQNWKHNNNPLLIQCNWKVSVKRGTESRHRRWSIWVEICSSNINYESSTSIDTTVRNTITVVLYCVVWVINSNCKVLSFRPSEYLYICKHISECSEQFPIKFGIEWIMWLYGDLVTFHSGIVWPRHLLILYPDLLTPTGGACKWEKLCIIPNMLLTDL